jgi:hypothetical protein
MTWAKILFFMLLRHGLRQAGLWQILQTASLSFSKNLTV